MKRFLMTLGFVGLLSTPALAAPDAFDYAAPAVGGAAVGVVSSGAVGSVAAVSAATSAAAGFGFAVMGDILINGNDSLLAQGVMGLCSLLGGEQSPDDNYQTCK